MEGASKAACARITGEALRDKKALTVVEKGKGFGNMMMYRNADREDEGGVFCMCLWVGVCVCVRDLCNVP